MPLLSIKKINSMQFSSLQHSYKIYPIISCFQEDVQQYYSQPLRFTTEDATVNAINVTGLQPDTKYKVQV